MKRATGGILCVNTKQGALSLSQNVEYFHSAAENGDREHLGGQLAKANLAVNQGWHGKHDDGDEDDTRICNSYQQNKTLAIELNLAYMHSKVLRSINNIFHYN